MFAGMARWVAALLVAALLAGEAAAAKRSKDKDKEGGARDQRKKSVGAGPAPPPPVPLGSPRGTMNVCDSFHHRTLNVYCHCSTLQMLNATEAACWVFGKGENETAPIWDSFSSQVSEART